MGGGRWFEGVDLGAREALEPDHVEPARPTPRLARDRAADRVHRDLVGQASGSWDGRDPVPPGSEIWASRRFGYHHAGVYIGHGEVVHVYMEPLSYLKQVAAGGGSSIPVVRTSLETFAEGFPVRAGPTGACFSPDQVIDRALAQVGHTFSLQPT
jgi:hypothetical protein